MRGKVFDKTLRLGALALALSAGLGGATAQAQSASKPAKAPQLFDELQIRNSTSDDDQPVAKAPVQAAAAGPALEFPALQHAVKAGAHACLGAFGQTLRRSIDAPHEAHSLWSINNPDQHAFSTIAGLRYANAIAPRGVVIASAGPNSAAGCDTMSVQVLPSTRSCSSIQGSLGSGVKASGKIGDLPLLELPDGLRIVLTPTAGGGCVLVGVNVAFLK